MPTNHLAGGTPLLNVAPRQGRLGVEMFAVFDPIFRHLRATPEIICFSGWPFDGRPVFSVQSIIRDMQARLFDTDDVCLCYPIKPKTSVVSLYHRQPNPSQSGLRRMIEHRKRVDFGG